MRRVLITGAHGQVGKCLDLAAPNDVEIIALSRQQLDISSRDAVMDLFANHDFDICFNCAAYTAVDKAESEPELARLINADAVHHIAAACARHKTLLFHYSTDYVYDNGLARPLKETDPTRPASVYARTKLAGEEMALYGNPDTIVLRTSWVYSEFGHNFAKTMVRLADSGIDPKVVADQTGAPTYARDLAEASWAMSEDYEPGRAGIYNFANSGVTNWYEFARAIFDLCGQKDKVSPITSEEFGAAAPRPAYSVMDCSKLGSVFGILPRPWQEALSECYRRLKEQIQSDN